MSSIRQILLDGRISELLPENEDDRFPIVCFRESDSIGFVLRKFASESLMSALVLKDSAVSDNPTDHRDRSFSTIYMRDIVGFVDLHTILSNLLRGALPFLIVIRSPFGSCGCRDSRALLLQNYEGIDLGL
jgi:hypothetical protein